MVSSTLVLLPGTVCLLIHMTLQTQIHSRSGLKLFCLIVHTDLLLLLYGAPGRFVQIAHCNCIVLFGFRPFHLHVTTLGSCSHACASTTKQYNLLLAKGWLHCPAVKGWWKATPAYCGLTAWSPGSVVDPTIVLSVGLRPTPFTFTFSP